jgi:hypothetical protein
MTVPDGGAGDVNQPKRPQHQRVRDHLGPGLVAVLWGELLAVHPTEVLGMMSQSRKTGFLFVERDGVERLFGFINGELVLGTSTAGGEEDDPSAAVLGLLRQPAGGTFTFLRGPAGMVPPAFPPQNMQRLMMDSLLKLDETGQLAG